jgi:hypothetical protein
MYSRYISKLGLEFEISNFHDCNNWVHLLLVLSRKRLGTSGEAPFFREIMICFDTDSFSYSKLLDMASSTERHLILLGMELCSWLYLKDVEVDFTAQPLSSNIVQPTLRSPILSLERQEESKVQLDWSKTLAKRACRLKCLTLVDSSVRGLSRLLDSVG